MTPEEIAEREALRIAEEERSKALENAKLSAIEKLKALGLTVEEIKAILGLDFDINLNLSDGV